MFLPPLSSLSPNTRDQQQRDYYPSFPPLLPKPPTRNSKVQRAGCAPTHPNTIYPLAPGRGGRRARILAAAVARVRPRRGRHRAGFLPPRPGRHAHPPHLLLQLLLLLVLIMTIRRAPPPPATAPPPPLIPPPPRRGPPPPP